MQVWVLEVFPDTGIHGIIKEQCLSSIGNQISWFLCGRMPLWCHRSQTLGMMVLYLASMFRGDTKLTIGTKINIIQWLIAKLWGVGNNTSFVSSGTKNGLRLTRVNRLWHFPRVGYAPGPCSGYVEVTTHSARVNEY